MSNKTMYNTPLRGPRSVDLTSVDLDAGCPRWALMALNPSGERRFMVRTLGSGHQSNAVLFREHGGPKGRLSVLKWNREAYGEVRMARPDREAQVARLLSSSRWAPRFARLLSSQDLKGGYRQSWWEFYNVGSMQDVSMAIFEQSSPPFSLVFHILGQCLEGVQGMNKELAMFHMDLHTGNVFTHLDDGASYLNAVIGDFGYSRLPGEGPPDYNFWEWSRLNSAEREGRSSPPMTYGERSGVSDHLHRLPWDLNKLLFNIREDLLDNLDEDDERNQLLFSLFKRMDDMNEQDRKDRKLPEAERPPIQDLTQTIQDVKTLERLYAATASDKQALGELREKLLELLNEEPLELLVFDNERAARDHFQDYTALGMFKIVNLADESSIEAATVGLAALSVEGTAYVADYSDSSSSSPGHRMSTTSSEVRESTAAGDPERQVSENGSGEQYSPTTSSHPSTRWTPATRGLASASAFADGDTSAVGGLIGARDHAERDHALVRDEHARRRRWQRVREGFLRR